ncbi:MAG: hypothetical protein A4E53_02867 [Pelotomaculum sp. PtaB.Bin104]|nr:MAG: hypothetical protein A4E53_02867 [Pelotomaculum sp. PtaB.Bin104]
MSFAGYSESTMPRVAFSISCMKACSSHVLNSTGNLINVSWCES